MPATARRMVSPRLDQQIYAALERFARRERRSMSSSVEVILARVLLGDEQREVDNGGLGSCLPGGVPVDG